MSGLFDKTLPQSLYPTLPNVFAMRLQNKTAKTGDTDAGAVADTRGTVKTVNVRRRPPTDAELAQAQIARSDKVVVFSVLDDGSDATFEAPRVEGRITDESGVVWEIKSVKATVLETLFSCMCVRDW